MLDEFIRGVIYVSIYLGLFIITFYLLGILERKKKNVSLVKFPMVTIIVPAYNEQDVLEKTVDSVVNLDYPKNKLEIFIVNDGSKDNTKEIADRLAKKYSNVQAFHKPNGGKASAMNYGIKRSHGEIIISFDSDSMVTPNSLKAMLPYFNDPEVMCVTPSMKVYKPKGILQRIQAVEYDMGIFLRKVFSYINAIHVTPGPFSAYRKSFFEKHGGYDEKNITEDMEVAMRIQSLNYKIENSTQSLVYTISPNKFMPLLKQRRRWYFGMIYNLKKYKYMFSKDYGELGLIVFPLAIFSIVTTMIVSAYFIYRSIMSTIEKINLYSLIGFDFIHNIHFGSQFITLSLFNGLSENIILFSLLFFAVSMTLLIVINRRIGSLDRPISTFISYFFYVFLYGLLFSFWWAISIVYSIFKKEINW